jgi:predicted acetyltransferase
MDYEIRYATDAEFAAVAELDGASFGFQYGEQELADARLDIDPARIRIAARGPQIVGVSAELSFVMALPGGADVPTLGLTWVSVELTHRRRGVLSALVEEQLRRRTAAGDAAAVLSASEGGIYGRYGFGVATRVAHTVVRRRQARLSRAADPSAVRRLTTDQARPLLPELHERWRRQTPAGVSRDERRWQFLLLESEHLRRGRSGLFHLVHPDGYVSYRIKSEWGEGDPQHQCWVTDYAPASAEGHAALWQTLLSMDLVGTIESYVVPLDDPVQLMLGDPRGVKVTHVGDSLWVRPLDVTQLLGERRYAVEVECVLEVRDELLGDGRYLLRGDRDGATCVRTDRIPDVTLGVSDLGAVSLGGTRLAQIARAGRLQADDVALVGRIDVALLADQEPAHGTPL